MVRSLPGLFAAALLSAALAFSLPAAEAATAAIAVTATVLSFCSIAALPLAFPSYSTALVTASTSLTVTCTAGTNYNVGLDAGGGSGATVASRKLTFLSSTLGYSLYSDAGRTTVWGATVGTDTVSGTATGLPQLLTIYGAVPGGQYVAPGLYTDLVTATIAY